jgi:PKD repeat protein
LWEFQEKNATSISSNPVYTFTNPGIYTVKLNAFGSFTNDTAQVIGQVIVHPKPIADFVALPAFVVNGRDTVNFAASSIDAVSWFWDFGDPASGSQNNSTAPNPQHFYSQEGEYTVTLVVENQYGCRDSITKNNFIQKKILVTTEISEQTYSALHASVYPNPFSEKLNIVLNVAKSSKLEVKLLDLLGKTIPINWGSRYLQAGNQIVTLEELDFLPTGSYILQLTVDNSQTHIKLVRTQN